MSDNSGKKVKYNNWKNIAMKGGFSSYAGSPYPNSGLQKLDGGNKYDHFNIKVYKQSNILKSYLKYLNEQEKNPSDQKNIAQTAREVIIPLDRSASDKFRQEKSYSPKITTDNSKCQFWDRDLALTKSMKDIVAKKKPGQELLPIELYSPSNKELLFQKSQVLSKIVDTRIGSTLYNNTSNYPNQSSLNKNINKSGNVSNGSIITRKRNLESFLSDQKKLHVQDISLPIDVKKSKLLIRFITKNIGLKNQPADLCLKTNKKLVTKNEGFTFRDDPNSPPQPKSPHLTLPLALSQNSVGVLSKKIKLEKSIMEKIKKPMEKILMKDDQNLEIPVKNSNHKQLKSFNGEGLDNIEGSIFKKAHLKEWSLGRNRFNQEPPVDLIGSLNENSYNKIYKESYPQVIQNQTSKYGLFGNKSMNNGLDMSFYELSNQKNKGKRISIISEGNNTNKFYLKQIQGKRNTEKKCLNVSQASTLYNIYKKSDTDQKQFLNSSNYNFPSHYMFDRNNYLSDKNITKLPKNLTTLNRDFTDYYHMNTEADQSLDYDFQNKSSYKTDRSNNKHKKINDLYKEKSFWDKYVRKSSNGFGLVMPSSVLLNKESEKFDEDELFKKRLDNRKLDTPSIYAEEDANYEGGNICESSKYSIQNKLSEESIEEIEAEIQDTQYIMKKRPFKVKFADVKTIKNKIGGNTGDPVSIRPASVVLKHKHFHYESYWLNCIINLIKKDCDFEFLHKFTVGYYEILDRINFDGIEIVNVDNIDEVDEDLDGRFRKGRYFFIVLKIGQELYARRE